MKQQQHHKRNVIEFEVNQECEFIYFFPSHFSILALVFCVCFVAQVSLPK